MRSGKFFNDIINICPLPARIPAHMGLVLKHIERTSSGSFQYRRRVPKEVSGIITKRQFKRKPGASE